MDESSKSRARSLFGVLLGRAPESDEIDGLLSGCATFAQFRVELIADPRYSEIFSGILEHWRGRVKPSDMPEISLNSLMHAMEQMREQHRSMEGKLGKAEAEMFELLSKADAMASEYLNRARELEGMKEMATSVIARLTEIDRVVASARGVAR